MTQDANWTIATVVNQTQEMASISHAEHTVPRPVGRILDEHSETLPREPRKVPGRLFQSEIEGISREQLRRARIIANLSQSNGRTGSADAQRFEHRTVRVFQCGQTTLCEQNAFIVVTLADPHNVHDHTTQLVRIVES